MELTDCTSTPAFAIEEEHVSSWMNLLARQRLENAVENSALRPSTEARVDDFPIAETLRKITPWTEIPLTPLAPINRPLNINFVAHFVARRHHRNYKSLK